MIFYCAIYTGQSGDITNHFDVRKDKALKIAKEAAERPSTVASRVVKFNPQGHHQICELLNLASGAITSHTDDYETVWKSDGRPSRQPRTPKPQPDSNDELSIEEMFS